MSTTKNHPNTPLADLSPSEVRHILRPREGFAPYAKQMFDLYAKNPEALSVKGLDLAALRKELDAIDELESALSVAQRTVEQLSETRLLSSSNVYRAALRIYSRARSLGETDGDTLHAISGFAAFLRPPRRRKSTKPVTPTP